MAEVSAEQLVATVVDQAVQLGQLREVIAQRDRQLAIVIEEGQRWQRIAEDVSSDGGPEPAAEELVPERVPAYMGRCACGLPRFHQEPHAGAQAVEVASGG